MQVLKVSAESGAAGLTLRESLKLAQRTGILNVPEQVLCLHIPGGQVEVAEAGDYGGK